MDQRGKGERGKGRAIAIAAVLIGAIGGIIAAVAIGPSDPRPAAATASIDAVAQPEVPKTGAETIQALLAGIKNDLNDEEWLAAKAKGEKVLVLDPGNETAKQELAKAELQLRNQERFEVFQAAVTAERLRAMPRRSRMPSSTWKRPIVRAPSGRPASSMASG